MSSFMQGELLFNQTKFKFHAHFFIPMIHQRRHLKIYQSSSLFDKQENLKMLPDFCFEEHFREG